MVNVRGEGAFRAGNDTSRWPARTGLHLSLDSICRLRRAADGRQAGFGSNPLKTGEILVFVSAPMFDPAILIGQGRRPYVGLLNIRAAAVQPPHSGYLSARLHLQADKRLVALRAGVVADRIPVQLEAGALHSTATEPDQCGHCHQAELQPVFLPGERATVQRGRSATASEDAA
jgi:penicillin-binding protein 2